MQERGLLIELYTSHPYDRWRKGIRKKNHIEEKSVDISDFGEPEENVITGIRNELNTFSKHSITTFKLVSEVLNGPSFKHGSFVWSSLSQDDEYHIINVKGYITNYLQAGSIWRNVSLHGFEGIEWSLISKLWENTHGWHRRLEEEKFIEKLRSDQRLGSYGQAISIIITRMAWEFRRDSLEFSLPSIYVDDEEEDIELLWDNESYRLLLNLDMHSDDAIGILRYTKNDREYVFEFESDSGSIIEQIKGVLRSSK